MGSDLQFKGYAVHDSKKWDEFKVIDFKPKTKSERDVTIKIEYCGVCGSDLHTITGGWGDVILPVIPGHEIVGRVVDVGSAVKDFKVGDQVGVGAMVSACFDCPPCNAGMENYCAKAPVDTYNAKYPDGVVAQGGYSTGIRVDERFVMPIPKELPAEAVAPILCAGLTVYSPLKRNGAGPGKTVAVVGIGGLGHLALQFARALGAERVIAFSHSERKKKDAMEFGATDFVTTANADFAKPWEGKIDLIINTVDLATAIPLPQLLSTLVVHGKLIMVALPDDALPTIKGFDMAPNGCFIGGSKIGSKQECVEMLALAAKKGVAARVEMMSMKDCGKAVKALHEGKAMYRYVLKADL